MYIWWLSRLLSNNNRCDSHLKNMVSSAHHTKQICSELKFIWSNSSLSLFVLLFRSTALLSTLDFYVHLSIYIRIFPVSIATTAIEKNHENSFFVKLADNLVLIVCWSLAECLLTFNWLATPVYFSLGYGPWLRSIIDGASIQHLRISLLRLKKVYAYK